MPGPIAKLNNLKHGLLCGAMPTGCSYIRKALGKFRVGLEATVAERRGGEIDLYAASLISSALHWHRHALLASRWLAKEPTLNIDQRVTLSREVARAGDQRDRCLKLLGLDASPHDDLIAQLYGPQVIEADPPPGLHTPAIDAADPTDEPSHAADASGATPAAPDAITPIFTIQQSLPILSSSDGQQLPLSPLENFHEPT